MRPSIIFTVAALLVSTFAKRIVVTVGGNTTSNPGAVFSTQSIKANGGDVVFFNFTEGNHTVTQSTFAAPCTPAHITNSTINGFDTSFRDTHNGTAVTNFELTIQDSTTTMWFFDWNTCPQGGVGVINSNDSSLETLDGFTRNAIRLNGTQSTNSSSSTTSHSATSTATNPSTSATSSSTGGNTSAANRAAIAGILSVTPALALLFFLSI